VWKGSRGTKAREKGHKVEKKEMDFLTLKAGGSVGRTRKDGRGKRKLETEEG